ncbi:MAG: TlpA disulfide reductase family protein [Gemmatimonadaceae bacterium]
MTPGARRVAWGAALLSAGAFVFLLTRASDAPMSAAGGRAAPRFVAMTTDSVPVARSLDDYMGAPLLLNVWATWCDPCRDEMPSLETLYQAHRGDGLQVVAVSIDDADQGPLIREFVQEHGLTFGILHDARASIMQQYQVRGVPQTFLIARSGRILATRYAADWSSAPYLALVDSLVAGTLGTQERPSVTTARHQISTLANASRQN